MSDDLMAFPSVESGNYGTIEHTGMTLRDHFAAAAIPAVITTCAGDTDARTSGDVEGYFARKAYAVADALLAARKAPAA